METKNNYIIYHCGNSKNIIENKLLELIDKNNLRGVTVLITPYKVADIKTDTDIINEYINNPTLKETDFILSIAEPIEFISILEPIKYKKRKQTSLKFNNKNIIKKKRRLNNNRRY